MWYYKDLDDLVQGPFSSHEMNIWNKAGYFFNDLMVSLDNLKKFQPLSKILNKKGEEEETTRLKFAELFNSKNEQEGEEKAVQQRKYNNRIDLLFQQSNQ